MKAVVFTTYGSPDVLQLQDVPMPSVGPNDVLVNVCAASVNAGDWHLVRGDPFVVRLMFGLRKPKNTRLGVDIAGRVEAAGSNVIQFQPGDEVFGDLSDCGFGAFAEYVSVPEHTLARKPSNVTFEEAAAVPSAALTALQGLSEQGRVQPGQKVLINGASGGVGTFAVQIAKALGAEVTGVCSTRNVEMVRGIGADHVIDYKNEDFTQNGRRYDLILDAAAYRSLSEHRRALTTQGTYVLVGGSTGRLFQVMLIGRVLSREDGQRFATFIKAPNQANLEFVSELLGTGKIVPVIDRRYPLQEVADAVRYVEDGHAKGKVVVTIDASTPT
jgi:NADPH:quinone reductase-like Zn-dependent oxidoreductase